MTDKQQQLHQYLLFIEDELRLTLTRLERKLSYVTNTNNLHTLYEGCAENMLEVWAYLHGTVLEEPDIHKTFTVVYGYLNKVLEEAYEIKNCDSVGSESVGFKVLSCPQNLVQKIVGPTKFRV